MPCNLWVPALRRIVLDDACASPGERCTASGTRTFESAPSITSGRSFDPQIRVAHHLAPLFHLQLDARGELVRSIGDRFEAQHRKPLPDVGPCNAPGDF